MLHPSFICPDYDANCFIQIPHAIRHMLTSTGVPNVDLLGELHRPYKKIVCFFLDAFGWRFLQERVSRYPFLQELSSHGVVRKLTSQFPSTTAVHMTAFHTGLPPTQSGICEWSFYEPELQRLICPLPFSSAGDRVRETLAQEGVQAADILPATNFYTALQRHGVTSTVYFPAGYVNSSYSQHITQGAARRGIKTFAEALTNVVAQLEADTGPAYINVYHSDIDGICHRYGPSSAQVDAEIDTVLTMLDRLLLQKLVQKRHIPALQDTLLLFTADHGQVDISPEKTTYLNLLPELEKLPSMLRCNGDGAPLVPGGSCRDMLLYVKPECLEDVEVLLRDALDGIADVVRTDECLKAGMFGPCPPVPKLHARMGDLVLLPYAGEAVWWYEEGRFEQRHLGHHGGLTREEMEIPLLGYAL